MGKLLATAAAILIFFGPVIGVYVGVHPIILPFVGIACALVAIVRGAQPLPAGGGAPSPGAEADAMILANHSVYQPPDRGFGITDVGGAA